MKSNAEPQVVVASHCIVGEAPLWHPDEKKLYWVDIEAGGIFTYTPDTANVEHLRKEEHVGGFTIQTDGSLLLFTLGGAIKSLHGDTIEVIRDETSTGHARLNDLIADPFGRVFVGAKSQDGNAGRIYRVEKDASMHVVVEGLLEPNGFGFSLDRKRIYYTDTKKRERYIADYDCGSGDISNPRVFVRNAEYLGLPDGMTVDSEGFVWSAQWNGGCVIRYDSSGQEDYRIKLPVKKPSSITFGGKDYTDLYITTSQGDDWIDNSVHAGDLFCVSLEVPGLPEFRSNIGL